MYAIELLSTKGFTLYFSVLTKTQEEYVFGRKGGGDFAEQGTLLPYLLPGYVHYIPGSLFRNPAYASSCLSTNLPGIKHQDNVNITHVPIG